MNPSGQLSNFKLARVSLVYKILSISPVPFYPPPDFKIDETPQILASPGISGDLGFIQSNNHGDSISIAEGAGHSDDARRRRPPRHHKL